MDLDKLAVDCERLARLGGQVALKYFQPIREGRPLPHATKSDRSPVTQADHDTQAALGRAIARLYPASYVIGEEDQPAASAALTSKLINPNSLCWVLDPIDGTRNFMTGFPLWCVCVAALLEGAPVAAAIYSPCDDQLWAAARGHGATRNARALRVNREPLNRNSLLGCPTPQGGVMPSFSTRWQCRYTPRNLGSAGLHLALVADGTFTGAAGPECKLWDMAAGWLLVEEAGGRCTDLSGREIFPFDLAGYDRQNVPWLAAGSAYPEVLQTVLEPDA